MKYFSFNGFATRSEYWGVQVVSIPGCAFASVIAGLAVDTGASAFVGFSMIAVIVAWVVVLLATAVRRCRDAGINPWWAASLFIPYVSIVPWIVIGCLQTDPAVKAGAERLASHPRG